eukprot:gene496-1903_t
MSLIRPSCGITSGFSDPPKVGDLVVGRVSGVSGGGVKRMGRVAVTDIHDTTVPNALAGIKEGAYARCKVLDPDSKGAIRLSARPCDGGKISDMTYTDKNKKKKSKDGSSKEAAIKAMPDSVDLSKLTIGEKVSGFVKRVDGKGLFISLSRDVDARIKLCNLSDGYVESPQAAFPEGLLVEGTVISLACGQLELSLRTAQPGADKASRELKDFTIGDVVNGTVRRVETFGVFIDLPGSSIVGLAHVSELTDDKVGGKDITKGMFHPKQSVKAIVLRIDLEKGKMSLGMKPSYFEGLKDTKGKSKSDAKGEKDIDAQMAELQEGEKDIDAQMAELQEEEAGGKEGSEGAEEDDSADLDVPMSSDSGAEEDEDEEMEERPRAGAPVSLAAQLDSLRSLGVTGDDEPAGANTWTELKLDDDDDSKKEDNKDTKEEMARLQGEAAPKSNNDYERLVLASPNSSFVWIKYMAFCITLGDMEQARVIAERALQTVNFREEQEKFNVWVAWLNLENTYGQPPEEAVMKLFQRALQYNDQKKLYLAMLGIMERSKRVDLAEQLLKTVTKKFGTSAKVWLKHLEHMLNQGDEEKGAKMLMERALVSLPARKHIKVITKAALLEFKVGSAERGRGIFEGVLRNHPKRLDLWSVYIDQEVKLGDVQRTRALFERATHMTLPPKKMKFLFKRFLEYEKEHGDAASVDHVKKRAMEFVESTLKA